MNVGHQIPRGRRLAGAFRLTTEQDLHEIDQEIEELEAQLKGLKALREVVAERVLNAPEPVKPPKATTPPGATAADRESLKDQVGVWLAANSPATPTEIGKALKIDGRAVTPVLLGNRDLFLRDEDGWVITQEGRKRWGNK